MRDASLLDSVLRRGGQLAVHIGGGGTQGVVVARNHLLDSNTEGFDFGWEAGGLKAAVSSDLTFEDNVVENNDGAGLWCDIDCTDVRYLNNRVSHNAGAGIFFEISDGATIEGNVVWENDWADPAWGWGAGILISSSTDVVVRDNVVAWNGDGISVISQRRDREDGDAVDGIDVSANTVAIGPGGGFLLAWLQDWDGPMFEPGADNVGSANGFWLGADAPDTCHWEWDGCQGSVEDFAATPGGGGSRMLDEAEFAAILQGAELAPLPEPHVVVAGPAAAEGSPAPLVRRPGAGRRAGRRRRRDRRHRRGAFPSPPGRPVLTRSGEPSQQGCNGSLGAGHGAQAPRPDGRPMPSTPPRHGGRDSDRRHGPPGPRPPRIGGDRGAVGRHSRCVRATRIGLGAVLGGLAGTLVRRPVVPSPSDGRDGMRPGIRALGDGAEDVGGVLAGEREIGEYTP